MEEIYLTVKELADLKGCTTQYIGQQISKGKIFATTIEMKCQSPGRGGIQYRIPVSTLDSRLQMKFKRCLKRLEKLKAKEEPAPDEPPAPTYNYESFSQAEREEILYWKKLLQDWQSYRGSFAENKTEADESFLSVVNLQRPDKLLTLRTLYRKQNALQTKGEGALIDRRGKHNRHTKRLTGEVWDVFEYYYLDQSRKSIRLCMTLTELHFKKQNREDLLPLPSPTTFERAVKGMPIPYLKYFRDNEKSFIGECAPYIKRIYDDLESNDIWVADNHTFDIMINKNDAPVRVYLTAFMDVRSRKFTGWCITDAPSSDATVYALKKGCEWCGVPKALYTDNGREFLFHDLGGNGFRKRKKDEALQLPSILDDLGISFQTALPRNARAKGIERAFYTVKEHFSKLFESYTGGTVLEKPDRLKDVVKDAGRLPEIALFRQYVDTYIQGWYNKQPHSGVGMNGKSPDEVFAENLIEKRIIPEDKLNLMFMRYAKGNKGTVKVGKNGVSLTFYGQELQYFDEDLWKLYFGREVYVRYSPEDLSSVRIYDTDRRFLCTAQLKTELGYQATKAEIQSSQKENRSAIKAVKAYKKKKGVEAENQLKLILDAAARGMEEQPAIDPKILRPIYADAENEGMKRVSGGYEEPIDWSAAVERLRNAREESE